MNDYPDSQHKRNNQGRTPLHTAVEFGQLEILKYLMQYSRYPNAPGNNGLTTTMGIAASKGHVEIVKFLANHIADHTHSVLDKLRPLSSFFWNYKNCRQITI